MERCRQFDHEKDQIHESIERGRLFMRGNGCAAVEITFGWRLAALYDGSRFDGRAIAWREKRDYGSHSTPREVAPQLALRGAGFSA